MHACFFGSGRTGITVMGEDRSGSFFRLPELTVRQISPAVGVRSATVAVVVVDDDDDDDDGNNRLI